MSMKQSIETNLETEIVNLVLNYCNLHLGLVMIKPDFIAGEHLRR